MKITGQKLRPSRRPVLTGLAAGAAAAATPRWPTKAVRRWSVTLL